MGLAEEKYIRLSNLAFAAAMDPRIWQLFLDELGMVLGTRVCTQLFGYDEFTHTAPLAYSSGYDPETLRLYERHYVRRNPFAAAFPKVAVGTTAAAHQMLDVDELKRTAFYADLLQPNEDIHGGGGAMLKYDSRRMFLLGGNMRARDRDRYEKDWLQVCSILTPVVQQSLEVSRAISGLSFEKWAAEQHMFGSGTALFVVDASMSVHFACSEGERMLSTGTPVGYGMDGRLAFRAPDARTRLAGLLERSLRESSNAFGNCRLTDEKGQQWICRVMEMRLGDFDRSPFGAFLTRGGSVLLLALKPVSDSSALREALRQMFGLTPAEADTSIMLADGKTPAEIAVFRDVSVHTVRNQIKAAMAKTGCRRQSELVRKIEQQRHRQI